MDNRMRTTKRPEPYFEDTRRIQSKYAISTSAPLITTNGKTTFTPTENLPWSQMLLHDVLQFSKFQANWC